MANLKKRFKEILDDIEKNIKNKDDLEYIKSQIYNVSILFLDELDKLAEFNFNKLSVMLDREKELYKKVSKMEKIISNLEKEVFSSTEGDFEIVCPYCNAEFVENLEDNTDREIKCPECGNTIELDWNEDIEYDEDSDQEEYYNEDEQNSEVQELDEDDTEDDEDDM